MPFRQCFLGQESTNLFNARLAQSFRFGVLETGAHLAVLIDRQLTQGGRPINSDRSVACNPEPFTISGMSTELDARVAVPWAHSVFRTNVPACCDSRPATHLCTSLTSELGRPSERVDI
jgi:hypothetical protein